MSDIYCCPIKHITPAASPASTWPRLTASPARPRRSLTLDSTSAARLPLVSALSEPVKEIVAASGRGVAATTSALDSARAAGAEVEQINPEAEDWRPKRKFPLTLVQSCPDDALLLREEIFGPILPVLSYDKFDEALAYVNARPRPLALYLFDNDALRIEKTLRETISGGVAINDIALQVVQDDLPFGGVGPSGMGHCHAKEGFLAFSKLKPVFWQSRWAGTTLTRAPYGAGVERLLKWMLGR
ncbi:hypothetical protein C3F00_033680 [Pseudomonas sp. MWU13-2860]|nr:hypothetical protein C3F00_033680 [Pseudomonas sp. MWU13-2860]